MNNKEKIGVGIITYKRPQYFKKCLETIPFDLVDEVVTINDDPTAEKCRCKQQFTEIINEQNYGVGISKNRAMEYLIDKGCEHIFLIEDDVLIKDPNVFEVYIRTAKRSGIWHLGYGHVGGALSKQIKGYRDYIGGEGIQMYHNPQGSFTYFNSNIIKKLGMYDEEYKNAFEHADYSYMLIKKGLLPAFWWFPDVKNSQDYLRIVPGGIENSSITDKDGYKENWQNSANYFTKKWGHFTNKIPDVDELQVNQRLNFIENNYNKKNELNNGKKGAIIIPYRKREEHLKTNIPTLIEIIRKHNSDNKIFVIEQDGEELFNRGKLLNVGADIAKKEGFDYVIFHDVDLLPLITDYGYPKKPTHLAVKVEQFNYKLAYDTCYGGVFSMSIDDFYKINGYNNDFWGWGKEDDDFWCRIHVQFKDIEQDPPRKWPGLDTFRLDYATYKSLPHIPTIAKPNWETEQKYGEKNALASRFQDGELDYRDYGVNQLEYKIIGTENHPNEYVKYTVEI